MKRVATIPSDLCFVTTLAQGLWARAGGDPLKLSSMTVYLPTRRACRHLREAFLRVTGARAALLPRMKPLGDVDEVDLDFADAAALGDLPPAITPLRRQMLLVQLVLKRDPDLPFDQAASLAQALGGLLDQAQTEGRDFADLEKLVPQKENYAAYWQQTLSFLQIVTSMWPKILQAEGCLDPAERRTRVLDAQGALWQAQPPADPIIAAGSTGSVPAVGRLMNVIAGLPKGEVILPGLDLSMDEEAWQEVKETHPQFTMKQWLSAANAVRQDVKLWDGCATVNTARVRLLQEAMRPAEVTEAWQKLSLADIPKEAVKGLEKVELDHTREEADVIALRLRAALEEDGKSAALVTPDRALAVRVAAALGRWGITANDSAGASLDMWPVGSFLIDVLRAAAPNASPVAYLALLKHPLAAAGVDPAECRAQARTAEMKIWRGIRRADGWRGAAQAAKVEHKELSVWLDGLADAFKPFTDNWRTARPLSEWIEAHIMLAEKLTQSADQLGGERLWRGEAGEAAVTFFDDWRSAALGFPPITARDYTQLFEALICSVVVRPSYGQHPRLSILGPLEARLLHQDLIILGGLNEGVWPPAPTVDPWLSRPMKRDFGLPLPERRVGQSAHDFVQLCAAPQVMITRARRAGGSPAVPSRFILQLETVLAATRLAGEGSDMLASAQPWRAWAKLLDAPQGEAKTMARPSPRPPLDARPKKLSVTEISTWMCNPYAIYAKHVLLLKKLEDIDADISAADHGTVIHAALENFVRASMTAWPADPLAALLEEGRKAFAPFADRPQVMAFWWPRFERIAAWFIDQEEARRREGVKPKLVEGKGELSLRGGAFTLTGRADRIDRLPDGSVQIIDYKTGGVPSKTEVMMGYEPQLALLALMAQSGAFDGVDVSDIGKLSYWKLTASKDKDKTDDYEKDLAALIDKAKEGLEAQLAAFADPRTVYEVVPRPNFSPRFDDYAHLARMAEWGRVKDGEE